MKDLALLDILFQSLEANAKRPGRNLSMPGDPHYQPKELKAYLGYDNRVCFQIAVEWVWMKTLAEENVMPAEDAKLLTPELLKELLAKITTTKVTKLERSKTKHDILALLELMRRILPQPLHKWLHLGLTSYDIICTAYAIQAMYTFKKVIYPQLCKVDKIWRVKISETATIVQIGRTHLQDALPMTVGAWLSVLHSRFVETAETAFSLAEEIPGKFSGAVGTSAAINNICTDSRNLEEATLISLGLPPSLPSTQVVQPEGMERFYNEITLISAVLANLGDDVRHLQSSAIGEVTSASSSSSTMAHKKSNPIVAEQIDGMHVSVRCAFMAVLETLNSTLQRDLRYSNVMRSYSQILVFFYQQLLGTERLLSTLQIDEKRCLENFSKNGRLSAAELLHLSLQKAGFKNTHSFVNTRIVPAAALSGHNLATTMECFIGSTKDAKIKKLWKNVPEEVKDMLLHPQKYLGDAVKIAELEAVNALEP